MPPDDPEELDPGLAADRTRLAWVRTAIAFGAVGAAMLRWDPVAGVIVLAITPLLWALGRVVGRHPAPPGSPSRRLLLVTAAVTAVAVLAVVTALLGHGPGSLAQLRGLTGRPHG
jgi:uncharacterized membrane protein YidH (DUF202 family)